MNTPHATRELVEAIAKHSVEHCAEPCPWDAVAPIVQFGIKEQVLRYLNHTIPALIDAGWTPPAPNTEGDQA